VTDAAGGLVLSQNLESNLVRVSVNTSAQAAGAYQFRIIGESGTTVRLIRILK